MHEEIKREDGRRVGVSDTGGQKQVKDADFASIPTDALWQLAEHYGKGRKLYPDVDGKPNWRRGYDWSLSYAALQRHANLFWGGEDIDPETGSHHLVAVMWHCMALITWGKEHPEFDDRQNTAARPWWEVRTCIRDDDGDMWALDFDGFWRCSSPLIDRPYTGPVVEERFGPCVPIETGAEDLRGKTRHRQRQ